MLFPAAAFAVHQLRYELAYGSGSGAALSAQGHGYLTSLAPWVAVLVALALGSFLVRLARAGGARLDLRPRRAFAELWLVASGCLLATYSVQEWLEGLFAAGHPGGFAGVFGHGGWWAIVLSIAAGLLIAALLRVATVVAEIVSRVAPARSAALRLLVGFVSVSLVRRAPLADASAGRAPPGMRLAA
jgi:hypothetical protein